MKVKVLFFGVLSDIIGKTELELNDFSDSDSLESYFIEKFPKIKNYPYRISVNKSFIESKTFFSENDEIAFLPPFAGG